MEEKNVEKKGINISNFFYPLINTIASIFLYFQFIWIGKNTDAGKNAFIICIILANIVSVCNLLYMIKRPFGFLLSVSLFLSFNYSIFLGIIFRFTGSIIEEDLLVKLLKFILFNNNTFNSNVIENIDKVFPFSNIFSSIGYIFWALIIAALVNFRKFAYIKFLKEVYITNMNSEEENNELIEKLEKLGLNRKQKGDMRKYLRVLFFKKNEYDYFHIFKKDNEYYTTDYTENSNNLKSVKSILKFNQLFYNKTYFCIYIYYLVKYND